MYLYFLFVFVVFVDLYLNEILKRKESIKTEEIELIELRKKKDKTYEEQLRYMTLNGKYKKYISFSPTGLIKLIILATIISFFPKLMIPIFVCLIIYNIVRIIISRTQVVLNIIKTIFSYATMFLLFRLLSEMSFFLIMLTLFVESFIFNILKTKFKRSD